MPGIKEQWRNTYFRKVTKFCHANLIEAFNITLNPHNNQIVIAKCYKETNQNNSSRDSQHL